MPKVKTYSIYTPGRISGDGWQWVGREVATASDQNPKIDFGNDTLDVEGGGRQLRRPGGRGA